jgi:hypothetical protein
MKATTGTFPVWPLALVVAVLPFITTHLSFVVSALQGHVPWCFPYWEGCASISRSGRHGTAYFLFKAGMIPTCVLIVLFWGLNGRWLRTLQAPVPASLFWLGLVSSLALLLYTLTLGHAGDMFRLLRRIGVVGWFGMTWIAQLKLGAQLRDVPGWENTGRRLVQLSLFTLLLGLISIWLGVLFPEYYDELEDAFEWTLALLLNGHALWIALLWRRSQFSLTASTSG